MVLLKVDGTCAIPCFFFSHEFFFNVSIFLISSIGFFDDPSYLFTNTK
jgi:hypothetical protein